MNTGAFKRLGLFFLCFSLFVGALSLKEASAAGAAKNPCASREKMVELLSTRYLEKHQAMGLVSSRGVIELYVSASGSWTMLITNSSGKACILAAGKHWQTTIAAPKGDPV
ncbi:MAG: hypothetical protein JKY96_04855 [Phycisphaerales bacterium]|nr:hypothetical protein [Phycisphaerales bacterium]